MGRIQQCFMETLKCIATTSLFIETEIQTYILETAPVEIYSATNLKKYTHWRTTDILKESVPLDV